ncbi:tape measure protein [Advenella mimigardefordensis]|uniref:Putative tail tape measure protein n=1 Tax=Advenella mimigardefordensis (strain DSM 17166 / LMG 22922 / DPN7) TaxID=1247726 RepID=W0P8N8_ADVMD|nr:tape measure protein [Advenella mimigardefordensis]AHG63194.1 putative tail tape measure protein [Advenella mimigardefordensis DPN7]
MAARTVGVLSIDLVGNISGFDRSMKRATMSADTFVKKITVGFNGLSSTLSRMAGPLAAFLSVRQVAQYAQAWTELNNRLKLVTATNQDLAQASKDIYSISQQTGQALSGTSEVYSRIAKNATTYGLSLQDVAKITDTVSKSVAISGTSAESAAAGLMQFGQALASQRLGGEELNSILEQTPGLALAIAKGLGVPVGALKEMGKQGKLTGDAVVAALQKAAGFIDTQFSNITLTASQNQQRLNNALERYVGILDTELGGSVAFGNLMNSITGYIEDQTEKIDDLIVDIDWLVDQYDKVTTEIGDFWRNLTEGLPVVGEETNATVSVMERSFADFIVATLEEFQYFLNTVSGVFAALDGANQSVTYNLGVAFENAFLWIKKTAIDAINEIIVALNQLGNIEIFGQKMGVNIKQLDQVKGEYKEFSNIVTDLQRGFENGSKTFTFADAARNSLTTRRNLEWISKNYGGDGVGDGTRRDIDTGTPGGATAAGGKKKKKGRTGKTDEEKAYAREQKQFADWVKRQNERIAMLGTETELEKLNAELKLGNWSKLSDAQKEQMRQLADQVDKAEEYNDVLERMSEITGDKLMKEHLKDAKALAMAWQAGALSVDAYVNRMNKLNMEGAEERISRGMGSSQDMLQSILGKYSDGFNSTQEAIADSLGASFADLSDGAGDTLGQMIFYGDEANASFSDIAKTIGVDMVKALVKMGIQMLAQKALGTAINTTSTAEATATGAAVTSAMTPAAATASVATFGGAAAAGLAGLMAVMAILPALMGGFAEGGYTGPGGKYDPAGVVHAGEYVFNAQRVREIGLNNLRRLDQMGGFAEGGYVNSPNVSSSVASLTSGAGTGEIKVVNQTSAKVGSAVESRGPAGERIVTLRENEDYIASQLANPNSKISRAIGKNTHAKRRF